MTDSPPAAPRPISDKEIVDRFATALNEHSLNYVRDFVVVHCRCGWESAHTDRNPAGDAHREYYEHVGTALLAVERSTSPWVVKQEGHERWTIWHLDGRQAVRDPERGFEPRVFKLETEAQSMCDALNAASIP